MVMNSKSNVRECVLIGLLGSSIGFISNAAYHAAPDVWWSAMMAPYKFAIDGLGTSDRYTEDQRTRDKFHELSEQASNLAIAKACVEDGPTGAIIGAALGLAIATTRRRVFNRKQLNGAPN